MPDVLEAPCTAAAQKLQDFKTGSVPDACCRRGSVHEMPDVFEALCTAAAQKRWPLHNALECSSCSEDCPNQYTACRPGTMSPGQPGSFMTIVCCSSRSPPGYSPFVCSTAVFQATACLCTNNFAGLQPAAKAKGLISATQLTSTSPARNATNINLSPRPLQGTIIGLSARSQSHRL